MQTGLVSVIIPVYNRPTMLLDAVDSVVQQTHRPIEIIIVDDGSTDTTVEVAQKLSTDNQFITTISIENSGPSMARQCGLELANGEFIQYLDSDDLLKPEKLSKQVSNLNKYSDCDVSYCIQQLCDMRGAVLDPAWMRTGERFRTMFPAMLGGRIWGTPVPLYRSSLLQKSGPWLNIKNQEDWEYDCRIASLGVNLGYCPEVLVTVRRHDDHHFGDIKTEQKPKLIDKSIAYQAIHRHAESVGIPRDNHESKRFTRMVFMLARQCAQAGLKNQSKQLAAICYERARGPIDKMEYQLYHLLSSIFGWQNVAQISTIIEKFRE